MPTIVNQNDALRNYLLAALSVNDFKQIESKLESVSFKLGDVIYESGEKLDYVYFPTVIVPGFSI